MRRKTRVIYVGNIGIGGDNPIRIQSMTKTDTRDVNTTVKQIHELEDLGCEIIRVAVPDAESVEALPRIIKEIRIPLVADIHFDYRLAIMAMENGANGVRINPGNMKREFVGEVVKVAKERMVPIRIGVNTGSLERGKTLVESALDYVKMIEDMGYNNIKISVKAPDVVKTINAYREIAEKTDYPLHIGLTEAGPVIESAVRSSITLGVLLMEGIGDTMRVSVTGLPHNEVIIAKEILQSLRLREFGPEIISCPTCGRCRVDLIKIVTALKDRLLTVKRSLSISSPKIAVMGCVVNGPGEARDADLGVAFGNSGGVLFKKGRSIGNVDSDNVIDVLIRHIEEL